jgi:hypothetical protein
MQLHRGVTHSARRDPLPTDLVFDFCDAAPAVKRRTRGQHRVPPQGTFVTGCPLRSRTEHPIRASEVASPLDTQGSSKSSWRRP